ncbi:DNA-binding protein [Streptomyces maremycinicus]|nr:DNA-binding protein [Streptomyces sp. B9173]
MSGTSDASRTDTIKEFGDVVNMTPSSLKKWLATEDSKSVGQSDGGGESVGHASGRRIVTLLEKKKADLSEDDIAHMRKVVGYVHRHLKQKPAGDITDTKWRYSLMNWGHDPKK